MGWVNSLVENLRGSKVIVKNRWFQFTTEFSEFSTNSPEGISEKNDDFPRKLGIIPLIFLRSCAIAWALSTITLNACIVLHSVNDEQ